MVTKLGLFSVNMGTCSDPAVMMRIGPLAEELGYDSLWAGEHVVLPDPQVPPSPMGPQDPIIDPITALSFYAACTSRVRLGTGIVILPQRNPVVLAKELASIDVLSGGRLEFGLGVGYLEPEMTAIGVPMADRGARSTEYLEAMQALWSMPNPEYSGRYVSFAGIDAYPRPVQQPVPIVVGGRSPAAHRRAVRCGHGWYGFALTVEQTAEQLAGLRAAAEQVSRPADLDPLEISVTPRGRVDAALIAALSELGVHRVIVQPRLSLDAGDLEAFVRDTASLIE
jgi:probable F420-dependent oxidoreductase